MFNFNLCFFLHINLVIFNLSLLTRARSALLRSPHATLSPIHNSFCFIRCVPFCGRFMTLNLTLKNIHASTVHIKKELGKFFISYFARLTVPLVSFSSSITGWLQLFLVMETSRKFPSSFASSQQQLKWKNSTLKLYAPASCRHSLSMEMRYFNLKSDSTQNMCIHFSDR